MKKLRNGDTMCSDCGHSPTRASWSKLLDDFNSGSGDFTDLQCVEVDAPTLVTRIDEAFGCQAKLVGSLRDPAGQLTRLYEVPGGQILIDETPYATMCGVRATEWVALEEITVLMAIASGEFGGDFDA
jgi:hypothetical protein